MRTLYRNTDKPCPVCNATIAEHFSLHSEMVGEVVLGGLNSVSNTITAEFACSQCGTRIRPTEKNGLIHFNQKKVSEVLINACRIELSRDLSWHEFLPVNRETLITESDSLKTSDLMLDHYEKSYSSRVTPYLGETPIIENYLLIVPGKPAQRFSAFNTEERRPEEAVPARVIKKYDNDFNYISYYIPEHAVKSAKD